MSRYFKTLSVVGALRALVWGGLLFVALGLPLAVFTLQWQFHRGTLAAELQARTFVVGQRVATNPQLWMYEVSRLEESLRQDLLPEGLDDQRALLDEQGRVLVQTGEGKPLPWPVIRFREPLHDNGRVVGWVSLARSLRPSLHQALGLGLGCLALAVALATLLTRLPLRRLREVEQELTHRAYHDDLTDLLNREAFRRMLAEAVARAGRTGDRLVVIYLDLDRFKGINDTLGHEAGDQALRTVAERLREAAGDDGVVARLSGDEFALFFERSPASADELAQRLVQAFARPVTLGRREWHLGCSIGMAVCPDHGTEADRLLACADTAMLRAKAEGRSASRLYHASMEESGQRLAQLEDDLRHALARGEFALHYQPLVDLQTGSVTGSEALLRWQHPQRGQVPPGEFIAVLEDMGLIHAVGRWVLEEACGQMRRWLDQGLPMQRVSVNVSPLQFARQGEFVDLVRDVLAAKGLPPQHLQLELTEGTLMADSAQSQRWLGVLGRMGVSMAIDDFGTGYSSLAYLSSFPVSVLKVDRSFVRDMHQSSQNASIVRAVVQMARTLGLSVTAEGIETDAQLQALRGLGCDTGQGFGIGRPVAVPAFEAWLARARTAAAPAEPPAPHATAPALAV